MSTKTEHDETSTLGLLNRWKIKLKIKFKNKNTLNKAKIRVSFASRPVAFGQKDSIVKHWISLYSQKTFWQCKHVVLFMESVYFT